MYIISLNVEIVGQDFCSGGCQANHYNFNGDFKVPYKIACEMQKKRIECAIALQYYRIHNIAK